jgi:hypothetical protein
MPSDPPSYDAHRDVVTLNGQAPAYDNPVYARHMDIQNFQNEATAVSPPPVQPKVKPVMEGAEAGPLPVKEPLDDDDIQLIEDDGEIFGIKNPSYDVQM